MTLWCKWTRTLEGTISGSISLFKTWQRVNSTLLMWSTSPRMTPYSTMECNLQHTLWLRVRRAKILRKFGRGWVSKSLTGKAHFHDKIQGVSTINFHLRSFPNTQETNYSSPTPTPTPTANLTTSYTNNANSTRTLSRNSSLVKHYQKDQFNA